MLRAAGGASQKVEQRRSAEEKLNAVTESKGSGTVQQKAQADGEGKAN